MSTEIFAGISFDLPMKNKLRVARYIGKKCGRAWFTVNRESLPPGFPEETDTWSHQARHAWRLAMAEAWHEKRDAWAREKTRETLHEDTAREKKPMTATKEAGRLKQLARGISEKRQKEKPKGADVSQIHAPHGEKGDYVKVSAMLSPDVYRLLAEEHMRRKLAKERDSTTSAIIREALLAYLGR